MKNYGYVLPNNQQLSDEVEQNIAISQWRAEKIIDLRDTEKSRYFCNCFIIRSLSSFFDMCEAICHFHSRGEKRASFTREQNVICSQTLQLDDIAHEQTIICRQLFVCHVMGCWPMKRKKKLY